MEQEIKENKLVSVIWLLDRKKIIAAIDTTFAVVKRKPEKKSGFYAVGKRKPEKKKSGLYAVVKRKPEKKKSGLYAVVKRRTEKNQACTHKPDLFQAFFSQLQKLCL